MSVAPGAYLRDMREADGRTLRDVARCLAMLRLAGFNGTWKASAVKLPQLLADVEAGKIAPTDDQLLSLSLVFPFSVSRFRELRRLRLKEALDV